MQMRHWSALGVDVGAASHQLDARRNKHHRERGSASTCARASDVLCGAAAAAADAAAHDDDDDDVPIEERMLPRDY